MLTKRIIACFDVKNGRVVKGISFKDLVDAGNPVELAEKYCNEGADEIVFLDITASTENRSSVYDLISTTADKINVPLTVGGGVRSADDIYKMLRSGADKVSINTAAIKNKNLIQISASKFGSQCTVVAIDAKKNDFGWEVFSHGGNHPTGLDAINWAEEAVRSGAGELLITSMDADGKQSGYDNELLSAIKKRVNVPIIASGGGGKPEHLLDTITKTDVDALLLASILHFDTFTIIQIKNFLKQNGVNIRI
ncbi:MAG: imidazole glycerol phosphate synthase subunit HisF [Dehalococcoidia bacterium]|jgi:cyclase|nr:MAG: cyclase [Chloroflexota bacterium]|tara:strand:+ start:2995 stop:3750 length:756 start_codon:yes stop_codon:yes gene_type:complete